MNTEFSISKFLPFVGAVLLVLLGACSGIRIVGTPTSDPNFSPIGDSRECIACGQRALSLCQETDPASYPRWFGFDPAGNCQAECTRGPAQAIGGLRGPSNQACPYEVTTTLNSTGVQCPSGEPSTGDRDFFGHGPRVIGTITVTPDSVGRFVQGFITATWTETQPDGSSITLGRTLAGSSSVLASNFMAPAVRVDSVVSSASTSFDRTMTSGEEEIIAPADGNPLVHQLVMVGDTDGGDISDDANCNDDAQIKAVVFNPVRVRIAPVR